jgi:CheY-like chemotaxis protein
MARILLVDGNPENRKALGGLLRYRTRHQVESVASQTEGARKAVLLEPDLIMMNALLFMSNSYAFPRVLQQHQKTEGIAFLVHANGPLGEVTEKQIKASGMANILYLPASAEELETSIQDTLNQLPSKAKSGVAPVVWRQASKAESKKKVSSGSSGKTVRPEKVKSVKWPQAGTAKEQESSSSGSPKQVFQNLSDQVPRAESKTARFKPASFRHVDDEKPNRKPGFKTQRWETVDPEDVKNKR